MSIFEELVESIASTGGQLIADAELLRERIAINNRLSEVVLKGIATFGDAENFASWLNSHHQILGRSPLSLLLDGNLELVEVELGRIDHGVI